MEFFKSNSAGGSSTGDARQDAVLDIVDCTAVPPTEVEGDRYILDDTVGTVNADWDGASKLDIVMFRSGVWISQTPEEGWRTYVDSEDLDVLYEDDGSPAWNLMPRYGDASGDLIARPADYAVGADIVSEINAGVGVTVDGLTIKDAGIAIGSDADGDLYFRNSGALDRLAIGTANYVLTSSGSVPQWSQYLNIGVLPQTGVWTLTGQLDIDGDVVDFGSFPTTPNSAPTTDYQVANKKYVDDEVDNCVLLNGASGGQTINGGTDSGDDLSLSSTTHATKGLINIGSASAYDEVNERLGLGQTTPTARNHIKGTTADNTAYGLKVDDSSDVQLFYVRNDGGFAFKGGTVGVAQTGYTAFSNLSTVRTLDADSTTLDEVADVLGTLIEDLKTKGIISV